MKKRVAIICGGRSSEHQISCISARGVLAAIDKELFDPVLIGITPSGKWVSLNSSDDFAKDKDGLPVVPESAHEINFSELKVDLAFPLLHGAYGEDGTIQGLFEMRDLPYVGSGVLASAVAMDKTFAKPIYADFGLKVADGITVHKRDWQQNQALEIAKISALSFPLFVKPARSGSSRGTTKVKSEGEISAAIQAAHEHDPKALVEVAIKGREVECAVLGGRHGARPRVSVAGEIVVKGRDFYDFEAKYLDGATRIDIPAPFDPFVIRAIREYAVKAFRAIGASGLARVDFFVTPTNEIIINEINTMPGFTPTSAFPKMWAASGIAYKELITTLLS